MAVLEWELEWGPKREFLKTLHQQQGIEPDALKHQPRLRPWVVDYYRAFNVLSASRPLGMGAVGSIPVSEIAAYLNLFEVHDYEEREAYVTMIQALDSVYLKRVNKSTESKATPKASGKRR
jgi:hypothetical protein